MNNYLDDLTDIIFHYTKDNKNWDAHSMAAFIEVEMKQLGYKLNKENETIEDFQCPNCKSKEFLKIRKENTNTVLAKNEFVDLESNKKPDIQIVCKGCNAEIDYEKSIKAGKILIKSIPLKFEGLDINPVPGLKNKEEQKIEDVNPFGGLKTKRNPIKI